MLIMIMGTDSDILIARGVEAVSYTSTMRSSCQGQVVKTSGGGLKLICLYSFFLDVVVSKNNNINNNKAPHCLPQSAEWGIMFNRNHKEPLRFLLEQH